ncbi:hypothetical protein OG394_07585 [Kribbella sp. NBC_01245]|uniref:alpha/beta hydrolase family protein n=1 Tax=Kribbella sp. NBC_01245 TaxID=2903578 RepID=UPI002E2AFAAE|nr:hypothetical protein [Kribbella sp. NBC_01245]
MNRTTPELPQRRGTGVTRRRLLGGTAALTTGLFVPTAAGGTALAARRPSRTRLSLPAPTGPYAIGTVSLHLVDHARQDPWWTTPHARELMISVWYPAQGAGRGHLAAWMPSGALAHYRQELTAFLEQPDGPPGTPPPPQVSLDRVDFPITHARQGAPVKRSARPYPMVLFEPGFGLGRELGTTLVEDLASHGYVVVTISSTYDAAAVEFPDGRVEPARPDNFPRPNIDMIRRRADTLFVLDQLGALASGANPDAEHRRLPSGLHRSLDLHKIGMFGHSLGGATTAQTMAVDDRIIAGVNLDGSIFPDFDLDTGPGEVEKELARVAARIGNRPFLWLASGGFGPEYFGSLVTPFWYGLKGWRRFLSIKGSTHFTYTDLTPMLHQLAAAGVIPSAAPVGIHPHQAIAAQRDYIRAFFDLWLRNRNTPAFDGPSARHPDVVFYP